MFFLFLALNLSLIIVMHGIHCVVANDLIVIVVTWCSSCCYFALIMLLFHSHHVIVVGNLSMILHSFVFLLVISV
jgi:hypothetical protein